VNKFETVDMQQIADMTGVSRSTVSRALSGSPLVSFKTRDLIINAAKQTGYVMNTAARNFRLGRTGVIAVVLTLEHDSPQTINDPFFMEIIAEIAEYLRQRNYNTLIAHERLDDASSFLQSQTVSASDGVIFIGQGKKHKALNELANSGFPIAVWGDATLDCDYTVVGCDNRQGGYLATKHLIEQCHRKHLAFLGDTHFPEPHARFKGYVDALQEAGLAETNSSLHINISFDPSTAQKALEEFFTRETEVDGIVCCSDLIAIAAISAAQRAGKAVPNDVSVIGFDNISLSQLISPQLTTVAQPIAAGAKSMCESIFAQLSGERPRDDISQAQLIIRDSA